MAQSGLRRTPAVLGIIPLPAPGPAPGPPPGTSTELGSILAVLDTIGHLSEIVVAPCGEATQEIRATVEGCSTHTRVRLQEPSPSRIAAVARALATGAPAERVLVHSPERPQSPACLAAALLDTRFEAIVLSAPATSTFKRVTAGTVRGTFPRESLVHLLGPAVFDRSRLEAALAADQEAGWGCPDEITLARQAGLRIRLATRDHFDPRPSLNSALEFLELAALSMTGTPTLES